MTLKNAKLGAALRDLRQRLGLTMSEVSRRTGLAVSTLSKVESERMSLTYDKLIQLSQGLGVDITELFAPSGASARRGAVIGRRSINRVDDGVQVRTSNYDHRYLSTDVAGKSFTPLLVECLSKSEAEFADYVRHEGEEFLYVLEGEVEVRTEFYTPAILRKGESMWLDSKMGHLYLAHGDQPARVIAVCSGGEGELIEALSGVEARASLPAAAGDSRR